GLDQTRLAALFGLAAQIPDVHVERVRGESEVVPPNTFEDDRPRQHLTWVRQEEREQGELGAGELDQLAATTNLTGSRVELEVRKAKSFVGRRRRPAEKRAH